MMQAILTKFIPPTNTKPSRIKATCARGSLVRSWSYDGTNEQEHIGAAEALCQKFATEDAEKYGKTSGRNNPWLAKRACGQIPSGEYVHVFVK